MASCVAPHFLGLAEVLAVGRRLHLDVPSSVIFMAVEAADCATIGGEMHPAVTSAIGGAVDLVRHLAAGRSPGGPRYFAAGTPCSGAGDCMGTNSTMPSGRR